MFAEDGYEGATLRRICAEAGVGLGSLPTYVTSKADMIFLILNEEVDELVDKGLTAARTSQTLIEQILNFTEPHYRLCAAEPVLFRIMLSQAQIPLPGPQMERYLQIWERAVLGIQELVEEAKRTGQISTQEDSSIIAETIFLSFTAAIRVWIGSPHPNWRTGQRHYANILRVLANGFLRSLPLPS